MLPRISYGQVKAARLAVACLVAVTVVLTLRLYSYQHPSRPSIYQETEGRTSPWRDWRNKTAVALPDEVLYLTHLAQKHSLSNEIPWFARRIQSKIVRSSNRPSMTEVGMKFMGRAEFTNVRMDDKALQLGIESPVKLPMGRSYRLSEIDASDLLFGISTTYSRIAYADNSLVKDWERWLTNGNRTSNGARLILTLNRASQIEVDAVKHSLKQSGINAAVSASEGDVALRYADLVQRLKKDNDQSKAQGRERKYLALLDDDIFLPSVGRLLQKLARFRPDKEYYIGTPSERSDWIFDNNEAFTYGGGAVFFTIPLAEKLAQSSCLREIIRDDEAGEQWDRMLYNCVSQINEMELYVLPSFYNPEEESLYGNKGLIENEGYGAGLPALTLHHYKNTHRFEAGQGHLVTEICGESCFMQRFQFKDEWILVNGYAITHYPEGVKALKLKDGAKLQTQEPREDDHKTEVSNKLIINPPDRPADLSVVAWSGRRKTWRLLDSSFHNNGEVWQAYVKRRGHNGLGQGRVDDRQLGDILHDEEEVTDVDSVIVLIWEP